MWYMILTARSLQFVYSRDNLKVTEERVIFRRKKIKRLRLMYYGSQDVTLFCSYFILTDLSSTFPDSIGGAQ